MNKKSWYFKINPIIKANTFLWYTFDGGCAKMSKLNLLSKAIDAVSTAIRSYDFLCSSRNDPNDFTRKGKIGFVNWIAFMLNFVKKSWQLELDSFFDRIHPNISMTKQAFSQARLKISHEPFKVTTQRWQNPLDNSPSVIYNRFNHLRMRATLWRLNLPAKS